MGRYDNVILPTGGQKLSVSQFGAPVKAALDDIDIRINASNTGSTRCRAYHTVGVSLVSGNLVAIPFGGESWKTVTAMHSTSVNPTRMIAPVNGIYHVDIGASFTANATGRRVGQLRKNAAGSSAGGIQLFTLSAAPAPTSASSIAFSDDIALGQNDYLELFLLQLSGSGQTSEVGEFVTYMNMRLVDFA